MTEWESAERVQKNEAGEYRAMIGGEWIPVAKAQKNEQGQFRVMKFDQHPEQQVSLPQDEIRTWGSVPLEAASNIPSSAANLLTGLYQSVRHPIETGKGLLAAGQGGTVNLMPQAYIDWLNKVQPGLAEKRAEVSKVGDIVGQFYKERYGGAEELKKTLATDPVGAAADLSAILSGGAAIAPKASTVGQVLKTGAQYTNPMNVIPVAAKAAGDLTAKTVGAFGTHTGGEVLKQAAKSGLEGGKSARSFVENMRGKAAITDVLDDAKANIDAMGKAKALEYRSGMAGVSADKTVLKFDDIDKAVKSAYDAATYKGKVKNVRAAKTVQEMQSEIAKWKKLNPAEYHTPEGLDALKQKLGGIVESIPFEEKTARMVGRNLYNSVKGEIVKQAPVYSSVMKKYSDATEQIREIERTLSLGGKASVDTAMRKLQSLTRNNVSTAYGNRLDLARQLEKQGGTQIMPALAGQALNTWMPRGLGGAISGGLGLGGYAVGGPGLAGSLLALQSPRLMGETAFKAGQAARMLKQPANLVAGAGLDPATLANLLAISGNVQQAR